MACAKNEPFSSVMNHYSNLLFILLLGQSARGLSQNVVFSAGRALLLYYTSHNVKALVLWVNGQTSAEGKASFASVVISLQTSQ